jgi:hypothetical protein
MAKQNLHNAKSFRPFSQGCQMVSFQTKNTNLGKFWRALDWKTLIYFMAIWNILQTFGILYDHLIHFVFIWYIFSVSLIFTKKNLATLLSQPKKSRRRTGTMLQTLDQGDFPTIGRLFTFGQFF